MKTAAIFVVFLIFNSGMLGYYVASKQTAWILFYAVNLLWVTGCFSWSIKLMLSTAFTRGRIQSLEEMRERLS